MSSRMVSVSLWLFIGAIVALPAFAGMASISDEDMRRHVSFLAADELAGRETGEPSIAIAERYVATAFASYGLQPLPGQDDFTVPFALFRRGYAEGTGVRTEEARCRAGHDCRPFGFSGTGEVEAPVVFAGYGIHAPDQGWDDYDGLDVEGKLVLVLRHGPGEGDPDKRVNGDHQQFRAKARTAEEQGALGMLLATDPLNHEDADDFRLGGRLSLQPPAPADSSPATDPGFLAIHVSRGLAETLISGSEKTLAEMQEALDGGARPCDLTTDRPVAAVTVVERSEPDRVEARNVVGVLPGSDPELKHEWIVIGAHHDHVGAYAGPGDTIFNGADDNASGVSGVLELAQAFATRETSPRRTLVFATFTGEEKGLLGSRALVEQGTLPLDKLVFMLNLDMIGRNSDAGVQVFGDGFVRDLRGLVEEVNTGAGRIDLAFAGQEYSANSDHHAFYREGVPFMFFFTGTHEDYHRIGDHAEKLDYRRMREIIRLAYGVLDRWAAIERPLAFIHRIDWLGIAVEARDAGDGHRVAEVTAVETGSRAASSGLREGDRLVRLGGDDVVSSRVSTMFDAVDEGATAELVVERAGRTRSVEIERVRPGYMGVMPLGVDAAVREEHGLADDEGLLLGNVVPGGPSAEAGLRSGDIVLRMDGKPIDNSSLRARLAQLGAGARVGLHVLRDGKRIKIALILGERPRG